MPGCGKVYLIGAGPGDPDLMTARAIRYLSKADAIVYDRLVSADILALAPASALMVCVGKEPRRHPVPQERINDILVELAGEHATVVRLKGGDPYIFGRGGEEAIRLVEAGIDFEVVPGITAAQGLSAATRIPLTHRGLAHGVRYVTGHCKEGEPLDLDWMSLADPDTTLVVYMGLANLSEITSRLMAHGLPASTPVLAVEKATRADERRLIASLDDIEERARQAGFRSPVTFMIGRVVGLAACFGLEIPAIKPQDLEAARA
ncbi:uroporphyrinogen-III C-methyltransferase [Rhizobiales bacterium]|uniref:uroporphyrinogen-III C-methyltransferase n=1 Tax=Hongsoonwoonella zoysiae TaxID=2821844 RepID=UPI00155F804E|nr:uroporphyrinogen-III C-methyltransferase [Hongsoonwoonella zoysiae]NRG18217.1 uroporphyrinogen-III C-methyltransferase [Hongsoonwoonella zoysiae]